MPATRLTTALMLLLLTVPLVTAGPLEAVSGQGILGSAEVIMQSIAEYSASIGPNMNETSYVYKTYALLNSIDNGLIRQVPPGGNVCLTFVVEGLLIDPVGEVADLIKGQSAGIPGFGFQRMNHTRQFGFGHYYIFFSSSRQLFCGLLGPAFLGPQL